MGFLDKLKGAVNAVTGGGAKVTLEYDPPNVLPGDTIRVKISVTSTGGEIKSKGVFVDLVGSEHAKLPKGTVPNHNADIHASQQSFSQEFQIAPELVLGKNETKLFEGSIKVPTSIQPTFQGTYVRHEWKIQGRLEAKGNDPDSGWKDIRVGK
jgi:SpoOM protein